MTLKQLGDFLGVSPQAIYNYECRPGGIAALDPVSLNKLTTLFECTIAELLAPQKNLPD